MSFSSGEQSSLRALISIGYGADELPSATKGRNIDLNREVGIKTDFVEPIGLEGVEMETNIDQVNTVEEKAPGSKGPWSCSSA